MVSLEPGALSVFEIPEAADEGSVSYGIPISVLSQTDGHSLVTADWSPALVTHAVSLSGSSALLRETFTGKSGVEK